MMLVVGEGDDSVDAMMFVVGEGTDSVDVVCMCVEGESGERSRYKMLLETLQARSQADLVRKQDAAHAKFEKLKKETAPISQEYSSSSKHELERKCKQLKPVVARHRWPGRVCLLANNWNPWRGLPNETIDALTDPDASPLSTIPF